MSIRIPGFRLGIAGGGQLGRMMAIEARRMGIHSVALDPAEAPPALGIADECLVGDLYDPEALSRLASRCDVLTYEIEHIDTATLQRLEDGGHAIRPSPGVLRIIQDKLSQKEFLASRGFPVSAYTALSRADLASFVPASYPFVQKARSGGYDGRGVAVIRGPENRGEMLDRDSLIEDFVAFEKEIAVIVVRGLDGETAVYPVVEMVFDPDTQICDTVYAPARIPDRSAAEAVEIARAAVDAMDGVGVFAVEMFLLPDASVLVNEIAPRPHNSGHWTIEGALTNQFAQHVRAVCGLPLGACDLVRPSVMVNLLGSRGASGIPVLEGATRAFAVPGFSLHWYQKARVSPGRKMGHFTVSAEDLDSAIKNAERARAFLNVSGLGAEKKAGQ